MKRIEKTVGFVLVNENNQIVGYEADATDNGMCFKNEEARGDEIAYIPEYAEWDGKWSMSAENATEENGVYSYEALVRFVMAYGEAYKLTREQGEWFANFILSAADWESPETFMAEVDLEECILVDDEGVFSEEQKEMCEVSTKSIFGEW